MSSISSLLIGFERQLYRKMSDFEDSLEGRIPASESSIFTSQSMTNMSSHESAQVVIDESEDKTPSLAEEDSGSDEDSCQAASLTDDESMEELHISTDHPLENRGTLSDIERYKLWNELKTMKWRSRESYGLDIHQVNSVFLQQVRFFFLTFCNTRLTKMKEVQKRIIEGRVFEQTELMLSQNHPLRKAFQVFLNDWDQDISSWQTVIKKTQDVFFQKKGRPGSNWSKKIFQKMKSVAHLQGVKPFSLSCLSFEEQSIQKFSISTDQLPENREFISKYSSIELFKLWDYLRSMKWKIQFLGGRDMTNVNHIFAQHVRFVFLTLCNTRVTTVKEVQKRIVEGRVFEQTELILSQDHPLREAFQVFLDNWDQDISSWQELIRAVTDESLKPLSGEKLNWCRKIFHKLGNIARSQQLAPFLLSRLFFEDQPESVGFSYTIDDKIAVYRGILHAISCENGDKRRKFEHVMIVFLIMVNTSLKTLEAVKKVLLEGTALTRESSISNELSDPFYKWLKTWNGPEDDSAKQKRAHVKILTETHEIIKHLDQEEKLPWRVFIFHEFKKHFQRVKKVTFKLAYLH